MRTSETTPTIVRHGVNEAPLFKLMRKRRPTALSVPKCFLAKKALTTATGCLASVSLELKSRPSSSFWAVTPK